MTRILISLVVIGAAAALVVGATTAYFSDTETGSATISAGEIDISVNGQNPWEGTLNGELGDMKPCQTRYIDFVVKNRWNSNPVVVWKHIHVTEQSDGEITESECTEGGGTWNSQATGADVCTGNYRERNNLKPYVIYDMEVTKNNDTEVLIDEEWDVRLDEVDSLWVPLGRLEVGEEMTVRQSYHLAPETGNWAQGDQLTFDIDIYAEQLLGSGPGPTKHGLVLENKDSEWNPIIDGRWALLTYKYSSNQFDYNLMVKGMNSNTAYKLVYAPDPWPQGLSGGQSTLIAGFTTDTGGNWAESGSKNLGYDIPHSDDDNSPVGGKIWLVLDTDHDGQQMTGWQPGEYLFESNLIKYEDADE